MNLQMDITVIKNWKAFNMIEVIYKVSLLNK